jgi:hypothetical protein
LFSSKKNKTIIKQQKLKLLVLKQQKITLYQNSKNIKAAKINVYQSSK